VWNANFSADHGMAENKSGKFVELEQPSEQLTKAFAPHGLLQAGMQNKEDRSAKKQEELAREMGSSLINVPSKPPPPQTGLLGAVAAHERDRKNAGGIGATLTDRERERRQGVSWTPSLHESADEN
jgi:CCR4-NOT transcriptional complex subunit CAF120